jgi:hypothetical protein
MSSPKLASPISLALSPQAPLAHDCVHGRHLARLLEHAWACGGGAPTAIRWRNRTNVGRGKGGRGGGGGKTPADGPHCVLTSKMEQPPEHGDPRRKPKINKNPP